MKYTFESSDKETTAFLNFLGLAVHEITALARYSIKQSTKRRMHEPKTSHGVSTLTLVGDVDESADSTDCEGPGEDCSVLPFPTKPVPAPQHTTEVEGEESSVFETTLSPAAPSAESKLDKAAKKGRSAFYEFISEWLVGIDRDTMGLIDDIKQPDRAQMLRDLHNGPNSYGVLLFVKKCGGLISAIADVTGDQTLALALAPFVVPPASITFGELADTYEYSNPFKKDEE